MCGSSERAATGFSSRQRLGTFPVAECTRCTHRYLTEAPTDETLREWYDHWFSGDVRQEALGRPGARDLALASRLVPRLGLRARLLDIGSNFGETLLAYPRSYDLHGIELSASAVAACRRSPRLSVRHGFFEDLDLTGEIYDGVIALAVIEHVRDPRAFADKIASILRPGGTTVVMTGDCQGWWARRVAEDWKLYHGTGHLHFFSSASLDRVLGDAGLVVERRYWAGPSALTARLPKKIGRALHSSTTSLLAPLLAGAKNQRGDLVYAFARRR